MLTTITTKILHLSWLAITIPLYMLYTKSYLDLRQAQLLAIQAAMLGSLMLPGWMMHAVRLVAEGFFVFVVLDLCIVEYEEFMERYEVGDGDGGVGGGYGRAVPRFNRKYRLLNGHNIYMLDHYRTLTKFKLKQTFIWPIFTLLWLTIKILYTKATEYGIGQTLYDGQTFHGFLTTMDGWNCNYTQFTTIPMVWLSVLVFCCYFVNRILRESRQDSEVSEQNFSSINGYKIYLLYYLVLPSTVLLAIDSFYNFVAHASSDGLIGCYWYFRNFVVVYAINCVGIPCVILLFFYKKNGKFSVQESAERNSQVSAEEQIQ